MDDKLHIELVKLQEELEKLKSAVEYIESAKVSVESAEKIINSSIELKNEFEQLSQINSKLLEKIDKVDFPIRLDKLDATVATINQNLSNTQARVESIERNLKDEISSKVKSVLIEIDNKSKEFTRQLVDLQKSQKVDRWIMIVLFLFVIAGCVLVYLK